MAKDVPCCCTSVYIYPGKVHRERLRKYKIGGLKSNLKQIRIKYSKSFVRKTILIILKPTANHPQKGCLLFAIGKTHSKPLKQLKQIIFLFVFDLKLVRNNHLRIYIKIMNCEKRNVLLITDNW